MAGKTTTKRKDSNRMVLKKGESQRKDGSYSYRWTDDFGKRHEIYAKSLLLLREKENEILHDKLDGIQSLGNRYTLNKYFDRWFSLKRGIRDSTKTAYSSQYKNYVRNTIGTKSLARINFIDIKQLYIHLNEDLELKESTVRLIHILLNQIFDSAVNEHIIRENPAKQAFHEFHAATSSKSKKKFALTVDEQNAFLSYVGRSGIYHKWNNLFIVMLGTGLRIGELMGLTWDDVDFEKNTITVSKTLLYIKTPEDEHTVFKYHEPKTAAGIRKIPMSSRVKEALLSEKNFQSERGIVSTITVDGRNNFCFINKALKPHTHTAINEALRNIVKRYNNTIVPLCPEQTAPLPNITCHTFRHTFATRLFESGIDIKIIQTIMGHSSYLITMDIYTDVSVDVAQRDIEVIDSFFLAYAV